VERSVVRLDGATWMDLTRLLADEGVGTLVCGGISRSSRVSVESQEVAVIDNVAGTAEEVVAAVLGGELRPGFGIAVHEGVQAAPLVPARPGGGEDAVGAQPGAATESGATQAPEILDCLACRDRVCLRAEACPHLSPQLSVSRGDYDKTLEAAWDVACEDERTLCRLAELVYFALEMGYTRLGVAFCVELLAPASVLTEVLRRFFEVVPVCCKVRGILEAGPPTAGRQRSRAAEEQRVAVCDPVGLAAVLNAAHTDLNVLVGLCVGVDGVVSRESRAPTTTIFVKDKSLANNPVGAVYSHYHLEGI